MANLKKIISLKEASKISGYTQDYLGFLIRSGEIKGQKMGRAWFTSQEEINNYFFKRKVRQNKFAFREFFSRNRFSKIVIFSIVVVFLLIFSLFNFEQKKNNLNIEDSSFLLDDNPVIIN